MFTFGRGVVWLLEFAVPSVVIAQVCSKKKKKLHIKKSRLPAGRSAAEALSPRLSSRSAGAWPSPAESKEKVKGEETGCCKSLRGNTFFSNHISKNKNISKKKNYHFFFSNSPRLAEPASQPARFFRPGRRLHYRPGRPRAFQRLLGELLRIARRRCRCQRRCRRRCCCCCCRAPGAATGASTAAGDTEGPVPGTVRGWRRSRARPGRGRAAHRRWRVLVHLAILGYRHTQGGGT
jgi:hypothetical protein